VTSADVDQARENLDSFVKAGGKPDWSRIPDVKPAFDELMVDDSGYLWVRLVSGGESEDRLFDVFDPEGRYLGQVVSPFPIAFYPPPIIRGGLVYAVTRDELEVPFLVRARIEEPGGA
jgi:sugar lactone lactonase YvrE